MKRIFTTLITLCIGFSSFAQSTSTGYTLLTPNGNSIKTSSLKIGEGSFTSTAKLYVDGVGEQGNSSNGYIGSIQSAYISSKPTTYFNNTPLIGLHLFTNNNIASPNSNMGIFSGVVGNSNGGNHPSNYGLNASVLNMTYNNRSNNYAVYGQATSNTNRSNYGLYGSASNSYQQDTTYYGNAFGVYGNAIAADKANAYGGYFTGTGDQSSQPQKTVHGLYASASYADKAVGLSVYSKPYWEGAAGKFYLDAATSSNNVYNKGLDIFARAYQGNLLGLDVYTLYGNQGGGNSMYGIRVKNAGELLGNVYGVSIDNLGIITHYIGTTYGLYSRIKGENTSSAYGLYANVDGTGTGTKYGVYSEVDANANGTKYAGYFKGDVLVTGMLSKSGGAFKIDHPQDPQNKYLVHSFVESPEMKNIYDGIVTTDANGNATVTMPSYFEALNVTFRYQLTCIGEFAQAIIAQKISGNQFKIKTDKPNIEVSWQVTGVRNDAWAKENPIIVEQEKEANAKGKYLNPEVFKQPRSMAIYASEEKKVDYAAENAIRMSEFEREEKSRLENQKIQEENRKQEAEQRQKMNLQQQQK